MNSEQPYGAWTRPYYIGEGLAFSEQVFQVGYETSDVTYSPSFSIRSKNLSAYIHAIRNGIEEFDPDVIYAHETFPAVAAYLSVQTRRNQPWLVFDIHALHAAEYQAMLNFYANRSKGKYLFYKSFYSQRFIARRNKPIIAASIELKSMLEEWYGIDGKNITVVPNGAPEKYISEESSKTDPYLTDKKIALLVAPKNMKPNELAVERTIQIAKYLLDHIDVEDSPLIKIAGGGWSKEEIEIYPNIEYVGFVDDLIAYIDFADMCILPFPDEAVCGGARNKALDFFARGKCVISTQEGIRGLSEFIPGRHVIISPDDPTSFANELINVANNLGNYSQIGQNAKTLVVDKFYWQHSAEKVLSVFSQYVEN